MIIQNPLIGQLKVNFQTDNEANKFDDDLINEWTDNLP